MKDEDYLKGLETLGASPIIIEYLREHLHLTEKKSGTSLNMQDKLRGLIIDIVSRFMNFQPETVGDVIIYGIRKLQNVLGFESVIFLLSMKNEKDQSEIFLWPKTNLNFRQYNQRFLEINLVDFFLKINLQDEIVNANLFDIIPSDIFEKFPFLYGNKSILCLPVFRSEIAVSKFFFINKSKIDQDVGVEELVKILGTLFHCAILRKKVMVDLLKNEALLKEAQLVAGLGFWEWDIPRKKVTWSDETYELYKHPKGAPLKEGIWQKYVHPEERESVQSLLNDALAGKRKYSTDLRIIRADGEICYVHTEGKIFYDETRQPVRMLGTVMDITQRRQIENALKESESRFRAFAEQSMLGFLILVDGKINFANEGMEKILEVPRDEIMSWTFLNVLGFLHTDDRENLIENYKKGNLLQNEEHRIVTRTGTLKWVQHFSKQFTLPGGSAIQIIFADITDRKIIEQKLKTSQKKLEKLNKKLSAKNTELEAFVYSISHDLQAQIRRIKGFAEVLLEDFSGKFDPQSKEYLKRIWSNATQLKDFTDSLLQLSKITRVKKQDARVDLSEIAKDIINNLREGEPHRFVEVDLPESLVVQGDPALIRILLENILNNSWKFTKNEKIGKIIIGILTDAATPTYFVKDNGIGFDLKKAKGLFNIFRRLSESNEFEGIGIGLATAKRIVQRYGGKIWAESTKGEGATFFFTLKPGLLDRQKK